VILGIIDLIACSFAVLSTWVLYNNSELVVSAYYANENASIQGKFILRFHSFRYEEILFARSLSHSSIVQIPISSGSISELKLSPISDKNVFDVYDEVHILLFLFMLKLEITIVKLEDSR
jgi:hypothetical protein